MGLLKVFLWVLASLIVVIVSFIHFNKVSDIPVETLKEQWMTKGSAFIDVDGFPIHVQELGPDNDKTPIILLHGTGASLHTWSGWVEELSTQRRVIAFDLPAFGLTGPEPNSNYTIERYVDLLIGLMDKLNIERAIIAGNSLGGYIAWASAVLSPERVEKLILVDASGYPYESASVPIAFKLSQNPLAKTLLHNFLPRFIVRNSIENVYGDPSLVNEALVDRYYQLTRRQGNRAALKERFIQTKPGPLVKSIGTINVPTLILWGAKDQLIPQKFAQKFNQDIANSTLVVFENLGHVPQEEAPDVTLQPVLEFLANH
ncbi:alpha/beta fold hydrolase [Alteromonas facilis]|uniref:alpha/beta fold hydrolase n=1 Tax=Alteromonas facilis TaxID=2048004 RepID=UPI000C28DE74|nr:alpha/beta hydrolase [Alteromonas facilis]